MVLYTSLDRVPRGIRLLKLDPGTQDGPIVGNLIVCSLDDNPTYDALSYMWGVPEATKSMTLGEDNRFFIKSNLANALRSIRKEDSVLTIWIDAICINQHDVEERNSQVTMMRSIYTQATTVRVYINRDVALGEVARHRLEKLNESGETSDLGDDPKIWQPLAHLLQDKYWGRLWIQQELILAKKIVIHCNSTILDGGSIMAFQALLLRHAHPELQPSNLSANQLSVSSDWRSLSRSFGIATVPSKHLLWWRKMHEVKKPVYLSSLASPPDVEKNPTVDYDITPVFLLGAMRVSARLQVTDPRDRVYGFLGLVTDVEEGDIVIDYKKTEVEVQTDVARFLLRKRNMLQFLPHAHLSSHSSDSPLTSNPKLSEWPSWVPRWTGDSLFWPITSTAAKLRAHSSAISADGKTLTVQGMRIDSFNSGPSMPFEGKTIFELSMFVSVILGQKDYGALIGQKMLQVIGRLASTLVKLAVRVKNVPFDISDNEYFLYMLLILRWPVIEQVIDCSLENLAQLGASSAESFDSIFTILHACKDSDPTFLGLVNLERIVSDNIFPRRWDKYNQFIDHIKLAFKGTRILTTENGDFALMHDVTIEPGDEIWIIFGCPYPMILRPGGDHFTVVSPVSMDGVPGLMEGILLHVYYFGPDNVKDGDAIRGIQEPIIDGKTGGGYEVCTIQLK